MITKMKKLTFLVYYKEYKEFLSRLQDLGVVHVVQKQQGNITDPELLQMMQLSARITAAIKLLKGKKDDKRQDLPEVGAGLDGMQVLELVDALAEEKTALHQKLQSYIKDYEALSPWGDFDPAALDRLTKSGFDVRFHIISENNFKEVWIDAYNAMVIGKVASKLHFITVNRSGVAVNIDAEPVNLPEASLSEVGKMVDETRRAIVDNENRLVALAATGITTLETTLKENQENIKYSHVVLSTEHVADEKVMLLEGWAPERDDQRLRSKFDEDHIYYEIADPVPGDNVPIELSNMKFFSWFEPICKLYMLPKYSELDLTPYFAPFFMIFFGLCLGDSGYGLFLFLGATIYRMIAKKLSDSTKSILSLVQVLAVSTFFCGLLTGTFFGANIYNWNIPFLQNMKDMVFQDNNAMFQLSLIMGVIQIIFGMILKSVNQAIQFGLKYAISTIGWVILLLSVIFAVLFPSVLPLGGTAHLVVLAIAGVMIYFFNSPGKNIFLNIGAGLWDTYNMATGLLGDILSYVRLFALGLSGGILAGVFNSLATGMSPDNAVLGPIVMVLIFVVGHAINMFMNVLGAMVHPMRLTFVEFFKNSGYEGGGKEYTPFKK